MDAPSHRELEELDLRGDLAHYRLIFETVAMGLGLGTPDGRMAEANPFLCEMLGYSRGELVGRSSLEVGYPDDAGTTISAIERLRSGDADRVEYEKRFLRKDGSVLWAHATLSAVRGPSGELRWLVVALQDISRRRQVEEGRR